jgi:hypothetical protein
VTAPTASPAPTHPTVSNPVTATMIVPVFI